MASRRVKAKEDAAERLLADTEPLDTGEQQQLVASLEAKQAEQERLGCGLLGSLVGFLALLHAYLAARQLISPWSTRQSAHFHGIAPFWLLAVGDALSSAAFASSAAALLQHLWQPQAPGSQPVVGCRAPLCTAAASLFWLTALWRAADVRGEGLLKEGLRHAWLPLAPAGVLALVWHVLRMFAASHRDLRRLRARMYDFKKA